jgi:hypothetical protein
MNELANLHIELNKQVGVGQRTTYVDINTTRRPLITLNA